MNRLVATRIMLFCWVFLFVSLCFMCSSSLVRAQLNTSLIDENAVVHLIPNPQFPGPHTDVEISLEAYSLETTGASITWYINDVAQTDFQNERSLQVRTGAIGEKTRVRVSLTRAAAPTLSATLTIFPTVVDVILESHTYVPAFYKGRALPSSQSLLRFAVIIHDGTTLPESAYTYTWTQGSTVLLGGPVKGKYILDLKMPHYAEQRLTVVVTDPDGNIIGRRSVLLSTVEPELHFYERSPLRGLSVREVRDPLTLIGEETTIYGEPYFINARVAESDADFVWKINSEPTTHDAELPNAITLRHIGGAGDATINFRMVSKGRIPQFVEKAFRIFFQ